MTTALTNHIALHHISALHILMAFMFFLTLNYIFHLDMAWHVIEIIAWRKHYGIT